MEELPGKNQFEDQIRKDITENLKELVINGNRINKLRGSQELIIQKAIEALASNKHLVVRAPTGCGKTLAYSLIANFVINHLNGRVVIVCPTKNLQEQILETFLGLGQTATILYGSTEYHCPLRGELFNSRASEFVPVITLICKLQKSCKYRESGDCNYFLAHEIAKDSKLIITNYHKFLESWDSIIKKGRVELLIIDEAHNLEAIAEENQRVEISTKVLESFLEEFEENFIKNYDLQGNEILLSKITGDKVDQTKVIRAKGSFVSLIKKIKKLFEQQVDTEFDHKKLFDLANECRNLANEITPFSLVEAERKINPSDMPLLKLREDLLGFQRAVRQFGYNTRFIGKKTGRSLNWTDFRIVGEPYIRGLLKNILTRSTKFQFHVSATLGKPSYYAKRTGISDNYVECKVDDYPFNINRRRLIYISDSPSMKKSGNFHLKMDEANKILKNLLLSWPGNSMVYFRSREEAEIVYNYLRKVDGLRPRLLYKSYFKTGSERKKFIEKFGDKKGGILLGFGRMDQGIDLPGDKLTMVVMYSMPFSKRTFQMQKDYDYFIKYNDSMLAYKMVDLDVAARRICQLIGRLIRSEEDFGVGVIIDGRFFRFYKWMRTSDMFPEDMDFEFLPSNKAYPLLEKFWRDTKGIAYNEYIESRIEEDLTLEDFL